MPLQDQCEAGSPSNRVAKVRPTLREGESSAPKSATDDRRWGNLLPGILWAREQAHCLKLARSESDVLAIIASYCDESGRGFRLCIEEIARLSLWSRSTVKRALLNLCERGLIVRAGQIPVAKGRPVVMYDLGSVPEHPLPESIVDARTAASRSTRREGETEGDRQPPTGHS